MPDKIANMFVSAGRSRVMTGGAIVLLLALSLLILILSAIQLSPTGSNILGGNWADDVCDNFLIEYLSPFALDFNNNDELYTCQWRSRNTIFRLLIICVSIIVCVGSLVILCWRQNERAWVVLYWIQWFLFIMLFVTFVLDCDGVNTGYQNCQQNFEVEIGGSTITLIGNIENCYLTPFIYTILADLGAAFMSYVVYRISKEFINRDEPAAVSSSKDKKKKKKKKNKKQNDDDDVRVTNAFDDDEV